MHARAHNNVKPYKCDVCGKAFCEKSYLGRHVLIHTDKNKTGARLQQFFFLGSFECEIMCFFKLRSHIKPF
jgi:hypothetical protein